MFPCCFNLGRTGIFGLFGASLLIEGSVRIRNDLHAQPCFFVVMEVGWACLGWNAQYYTSFRSLTIQLSIFIIKAWNAHHRSWIQALKFLFQVFPVLVVPYFDIDHMFPCFCSCEQLTHICTCLCHQLGWGVSNTRYHHHLALIPKHMLMIIMMTEMLFVACVFNRNVNVFLWNKYFIIGDFAATDNRSNDNIVPLLLDMYRCSRSN